MLTPEEQLKLLLDNQHAINKILRVLNGEPHIGMEGLIVKTKQIEERLEKIEYKIKRLNWIIISFICGCLLSALVFGIITWDTFLKIVK